MKKTSTLLLTTFILLSLSACSISNQEKAKIWEFIEANSWTDAEIWPIPWNIQQTWNNMQKTLKLPENWKDLSEEELAKLLPECEFEALRPAKIINIDDVVQNCKKEEKMGSLGINWITPEVPLTIIYPSKNWKILENIYTSLDHENWLTPTCKMRENGKYAFLGNTSKDFSALHFIKNEIFKKKYISNIIFQPKAINSSPFLLTYYDNCEECYEYLIRVDDNHYIASSWTTNSKHEWQPPEAIYLIDWKIYNPGITEKTIFKKFYDYINQSKRYFSSFSGDNVIVKKITNGEVLKNILNLKENTREAYQMEIANSNKTIKYTLKTCEIPLK